MQILVMSVLLGYIAAMILSMVLQPAMYSADLSQSVGQAKTAEGALNRVQAAWTEGGVCASNASLGVACGSGVSFGACSCSCTVTGMGSVSSSAGSNGACRLVAVP